MFRARLAVAGLGLLASASFAMAGCSGITPQAEPSTAPATSAPALGAKEALIDAAKKTGEQTVRIDMTMNGLAALQATGYSDPTGDGKGSMTMNVNVMGQTMTTKSVVIGADVWMRMSGMPGLPDKWMHAPLAKLKQGQSSQLLLGKDAANAEVLSAALIEVERDGDRGFKGTIDLAKAGTASESVLSQLGDKAKSVGFLAQVDDKGRLVELTFQMSALMPGLADMTTKYSAFGEPVTVTAPPAAEVIEMPAEYLNAM